MYHLQTQLAEVAVSSEQTSRAKLGACQAFLNTLSNTHTDIKTIERGELLQGILNQKNWSPFLHACAGITSLKLRMHTLSHSQSLFPRRFTKITSVTSALNLFH